MKIFYCIKSLTIVGGLEKIIVSKANWFSEHGHEVAIITTDQSDEAVTFNLNKSVKLIDLNINYYKQKSRPLLAKAFFYVANKWYHKRRLQYLLSFEKPDILVSTFGNEMPIICKIKDKSKHVLEFHNSKLLFNYCGHTRGFKGFLKRYFFRLLDHQINSFDKFVILCSHEVPLWNKDNCISIPNFIEAAKNSESLRNGDVVIAVGRLCEEKDYFSMLKAWAKINKENSRLRLIICGDGPLKDNLITLCEDLRISESVEFKGNVKDISQEYLNASILLLTSLHEGWGLCIAEAQSYGIPTIAFDCGGGVKELITNEYNGILVKDRDIEAFSNAVLGIISNPEKLNKLGFNAKKSSSLYSKDKVMTEWDNLFRELSGYKK